MCGHMRCEYWSKKRKRPQYKGEWGLEVGVRDEKAVTTGRMGIPFNTTDTDTVVVNNNNNSRR